MCETLNTPYMTRRRIIENLKEMVFGAKAFERFNDKERETLAMAAIKLEDMEAVETCNLDLASENEELLEQIAEIQSKPWFPVIDTSEGILFREETMRLIKDEMEDLVAFIKNHEREDIPDNVWELCLKMQDKANIY
jgi:hypothetical protein